VNGWKHFLVDICCVDGIIYFFVTTTLGDVMNKMTIAAVMAVCASLTACATVEQPAGSEAASTASGSSGYSLASNSTITGTRIPGKKSEKMVSGVTGKDFERELRSQPNPYEVK
jgi:predicted small secreted protein